MSNVFLSLAIRSCCEARAATRINARNVFTTLQQASRSSLQSSLIASRFEAARWQIYSSRRPLSISARLETRQQRSAHPQSPPEPAPAPATTVATHTEGVILAETWRDYDPAGGLPLPDGELPQSDMPQIFGKDVDPKLGNYILNIMNWRRMSGALIDIGIDLPKESGVTREQAYRALEYLRQRYPDVDEQANGEAWVVEASEEARKELERRAVALGLYKPRKIEGEEEEIEEEEAEPEESKQGTEYGRARSGVSAVDGLVNAIRRRHVNKVERQQIEIAQKERALLHAARGPLELAGGVTRSTAVQRYGTYAVVLRDPETTASLAAPVERAEWVKYYEDAATIIKENKVPQLSTFTRLVPPLIVVLLTLAGCLYLAENYTPPPLEARLFPSVPSAVATLGALTGVLLTSFFLSRFPPFWRLNNMYFTVVPAYPYAASMVGAIFRHDTFSHLATNIITMWFVGLSLHEDVGRGAFLAIFLGTGVTGAYSALAYNVARKQWGAYIYGSSGAVLGMLAALCTLRPNGVVSIFGYEIPMAAWLLLGVVGSTELIAAIRMKSGNIDHAGHLGGLAGGIAAAALIRQQYSRRKAQEPVMEPESV